MKQMTRKEFEVLGSLPCKWSDVTLGWLFATQEQLKVHRSSEWFSTLQNKRVTVLFKSMYNKQKYCFVASVFKCYFVTTFEPGYKTITLKLEMFWHYLNSCQYSSQKEKLCIRRTHLRL